jgi:hypothetical protein
MGAAARGADVGEGLLLALVEGWFGDMALLPPGVLSRQRLKEGDL